MTQAVRHWIEVLRSHPHSVEAYCELAAALSASGELNRAELTLRTAVEFEPLNCEIWRKLGALLAQRGEWRSAVDALEQATALAPENEALWVDYAVALIAAQDLAGARVVCAKLRDRVPNRTTTHLLTGHIQKIAGCFQAATESYRRALLDDPYNTSALLNIVDLATPSISHPDTTTLALIRCNESIGLSDRINVCSALARIHENSGDFDQAFQLYREANSATEVLVRGSPDAYDLIRSEQEAQQITAMFDNTAHAALESLPLELSLIFIVGMPRSGTTLVEQILGQHPDVTTGGELPFMYECLGNLRRNWAARKGCRALRCDAEELRLLGDLRRDYLDALMERDLDGKYVTDKLPVNFASIGLIRMLFPDALIVHCVRDPTATCWSLFTAHLNRHLSYHTTFENLSHYYTRFYVPLMRHWKSVTQADIVEVRYEDLVRAPESITRELLRRCRLEWADACLSPHESHRGIHTASMIQARKPVYASSIERWRNYEHLLGDLRRSLESVKAWW